MFRKKQKQTSVVPVCTEAFRSCGVHGEIRKNVENDDFMEGLAEIECNILDDIDLSFSNLCDDDIYFLAMAL